MKKTDTYIEWFSQKYEADLLNEPIEKQLIQLMRYVINTSDAHDQTVRASISPEDYVISGNQTWVITQNCLLIDALPKTSEFQIKTKVVAANRFFITRQFVIEENEHPIMNVFTQFAAIDFDTRKMARLNLSVIEKSGQDLSQIVLPFTKLGVPSDIQPLGIKKIEIKDEDIDLNNHVNNLNYIKWGLSTLPDTFINTHIKRIDIKYGSELLKDHEASIINFQFEDDDNILTQQIYNDSLDKESSLIRLEFK